MLRRFVIGIIGQRNWIKLNFFLKRNVVVQDKLLFTKLKPFISQGSTVLDLGAFTGGWSRMLLEHVGEKGSVYAFEANPFTYKITNDLIKKPNYTLYNIALSNKKETVEFIVPGDSEISSESGIMETSIYAPQKSQHNSLQIKTEVLDDLKINFQNLQFVKCDVEGHEFNVFSGMKSTLKEFKPIIYVEILREKWVENDPTNSKTCNLLKSIGYSILQMNDNILVEKNNFVEKNENFIFIHKNRIKELCPHL